MNIVHGQIRKARCPICLQQKDEERNVVLGAYLHHTHRAALQGSLVERDGDFRLRTDEAENTANDEFYDAP